MRLLLGTASTLAAALLLYGCGSTSGSFFATALGITVDWPALANRSIKAPATAQSAVFLMKEGTVGGHDLRFVMNRDVGDGGGSRRYTTPQDVKVGRWDYEMDFFSGTDGSGEVVATTSGQIDVYPNGTSSLDGTVITPAGVTIASVVVNPNQVAYIGLDTTLTFTAYDASQRQLALPPHSGFFSVATGTSILQVHGDVATGLTGGTASVTVTVNGNTTSPVTSPPVDVLVVLQVTRVVVDAGQSVRSGSTVTLTFTAYNAQNQVVTLPAHSGIFTVTSGGQYLTVTSPDQATGVREPPVGTPQPQVTVTIYKGTPVELTSAAETVTVLPPPGPA